MAPPGFFLTESSKSTYNLSCKELPRSDFLNYSIRKVKSSFLVMVGGMMSKVRVAKPKLTFKDLSEGSAT